MKLLVVIPHFYDRSRQGAHGSLSSAPSMRLKGLVATITALHQFVGPEQGMIDIHQRSTIPANQAIKSRLQIIVLTTGSRHLMSAIGPLEGMISHRSVEVEPDMLGFACHEVLRENLDQFDYFCYLEDDIIVHDPWLFQKLDWFATLFGNKCLLMPNRFELCPTARLQKVYVDGDLGPHVLSRLGISRDSCSVSAMHLGVAVDFHAPLNPHSGCFFLNSTQMAEWADQDHFLDRDTSFIGPLESAATLGIRRTFDIYKPVPRCAAFLEVHHFGTQFISQLDRGIKVHPPFSL